MVPYLEMGGFNVFLSRKLFCFFCLGTDGSNGSNGSNVFLFRN